MADVFRIKGWTAFVSGHRESEGQQVSTEQEQNLFFSACPFSGSHSCTDDYKSGKEVFHMEVRQNNLLKILELVEHDWLNYYYLVNLTFVFWSVEVDWLSHVVHCYVYGSLVSCH